MNNQPISTGKSNHLLNKLSGYTFLNTRPKESAASLDLLIQHQGGHSINLPCIEIIAPPHPEQLAEKIKNLINVDYAIFVSANAVRYAAPYWPKHPIKVIAIGAGTAKALKAFQLQADYMPEDFSSEGLLKLPVLHNVKELKISLLCGENPRTLLSEMLTQRGAKVDKIICYSRRCPSFDSPAQLTTLLNASIDLIISTSLESLDNLSTMLGTGSQEWLLNHRLLVISHTMLKRAQQLGFKHPPLLASNASNEAIIECLLAHFAPN